MKRIRSDAYKESQKKYQRERYQNDAVYRKNKNEMNMNYYEKTKHLEGRNHGLTGTGAWKSWKSMRSRVLCLSSFGHEAYKKYSIDPRWDSFVNFYNDMGDRPKGMTLDRKDNRLGYCKSNCRWATAKQQVRNKTTNKLTPALVGEIKSKLNSASYSQIANLYGVHPATVCDIAKGRTWIEEVPNV